MMMMFISNPHSSFLTNQHYRLHKQFIQVDGLKRWMKQRL